MFAEKVDGRVRGAVSTHRLTLPGSRTRSMRLECKWQEGASELGCFMKELILMPSVEVGTGCAPDLMLEP